MRELTVSELDAVGGGQVTVGGNLTLGNITQMNTASVTQTVTATATNSGAIAATATGGSASAIGAEALNAITSTFNQANSISF
jgi:hypothetical protein